MSYVQLYLKEEIQAEALVRNLPGFARFLPVAALFHGQVLNVAGLARDAGVARTTIAGYLEILADTHLAWLVPGFEARLRVKERQHPKLYWVDPGVVRAMRRDRHVPTAAERGPLFEGWLAIAASGLRRSRPRRRPPLRRAVLLGPVRARRGRGRFRDPSRRDLHGHRSQGQGGPRHARLEGPARHLRPPRVAAPPARLHGRSRLPDRRWDRGAAGGTVRQRAPGGTRLNRRWRVTYTRNSLGLKVWNSALALSAQP